MDPAGSAMLTPRAKTYVSVMKDTLDIRVGHRKRGGEAAEQQVAPVVARKQLVDLESEAALMFPARADLRKRGSAPPSRERMEREMRGVVTDPLPTPQWMASLGSLHASIAPSRGGGGDDGDSDGGGGGDGDGDGSGGGGGGDGALAEDTAVPAPGEAPGEAATSGESDGRAAAEGGEEAENSVAAEPEALDAAAVGEGEGEDDDAANRGAERDNQSGEDLAGQGVAGEGGGVGDSEFGGGGITQGDEGGGDGGGGGAASGAAPATDEAPGNSALPSSPAPGEAKGHEESRRPARRRPLRSVRSVQHRGDELRARRDHRLAGAAFLHGLSRHPASGQLQHGFLEALQSLRFEHARLDLPGRASGRSLAADSLQPGVRQGMRHSVSLPVLPSIKQCAQSPAAATRQAAPWDAPAT
jgi:hypothetical protein